jgi:hypothetical protein
MQPTPELARRVARDFARRIVDRPEAVSLYVSLDDKTIVLWLEKGLLLEDVEDEMETEIELHQLVAQTNDRYPDEYVELRIVDKSRSHLFVPGRILPQDAERIALHEVVSDIDGAEDTRPY